MQPDVITDPLICEIITTHLQDKEHTAYRAISYCWGSNSAQQILIVYSQGTPPTQTKCSANLYSALIHLRYPEKPRIIWADARSINQEYIDELANQHDGSDIFSGRDCASLAW